ncbi:hypothetical protein H8911_10670 [Holdemanella sp. L34]|uniref:Transposase n=1 Tax=Holdemanella hominis TaxID=2764327 RepID=A0ABR7KK97_9FIRM|nr:hypothetical protein [Holdemanella hominis]
MGTPLYRQEQDLNRQNICINRQNMSNWMIAQMIIWNMYSIRCVTTLKSWRLYIWMKHHFKSLKTVRTVEKRDMCGWE